MPDNSRKVYWDSSVFLSSVEADAERIRALDELLEEIEENSDSRILTSTMSEVEVAYAASERKAGALDAEVEEKIEALWADRSVVTMVEFHRVIGRDARALIRGVLEHGWSLKPVDAEHLVAARWAGASEFHTYDRRLSKFEPITALTICEPYVRQPGLGLEEL
jgi:predicted nucleic acid-binding protein